MIIPALLDVWKTVEQAFYKPVIINIQIWFNMVMVQIDRSLVSAGRVPKFWLNKKISLALFRFSHKCRVVLTSQHCSHPHSASMIERTRLSGPSWVIWVDKVGLCCGREYLECRAFAITVESTPWPILWAIGICQAVAWDPLPPPKIGPFAFKCWLQGYHHRLLKGVSLSIKSRWFCQCSWEL